MTENAHPALDFIVVIDLDRDATDASHCALDAVNLLLDKHASNASRAPLCALWSTRAGKRGVLRHLGRGAIDVQRVLKYSEAVPAMGLGQVLLKAATETPCPRAVVVTDGRRQLGVQRTSLPGVRDVNVHLVLPGVSRGCRDYSAQLEAQLPGMYDRVSAVCRAVPAWRCEVFGQLRARAPIVTLRAPRDLGFEFEEDAAKSPEPAPKAKPVVAEPVFEPDPVATAPYRERRSIELVEDHYASFYPRKASLRKNMPYVIDTWCPALGVQCVSDSRYPNEPWVFRGSSAKLTAMTAYLQGLDAGFAS